MKKKGLLVGILSIPLYQDERAKAATKKLTRGDGEKIGGKEAVTAQKKKRDYHSQKATEMPWKT